VAAYSLRDGKGRVVRPALEGGEGFVVEEWPPAELLEAST
jgi:hypothetical protein